MNFWSHPLLQIVLRLPESESEQGYLIAMRRVLNPILAGGIPASPQDLEEQKTTQRAGDAMQLLASSGVEDDWIFPARVVRDRLADFSQMREYEAWHVPEFKSMYHRSGGLYNQHR